MMAPRQATNRTGVMGTNMKHYAIDQWADFTRGTLADVVRREMQTHLADGCAKCREISDFSTKLTEACTSLTRNPVPDYMVRLARATSRDFAAAVLAALPSPLFTLRFGSAFLAALVFLIVVSVELMWSGFSHDRHYVGIQPDFPSSQSTQSTG